MLKQDLPEYFEDHMAEWMEGFAKLLEYKNPALVDDSEEMNPGKIVVIIAGYFCLHGHQTSSQ
jgi:exportin-2 (importin alpha re-exporter)